MAKFDLTSDFRSDTLTQPTAGMKDAMLAAPLGDDVFDEDPTVHDLQQEAVRLTGHEAALLFPSGTMANLTAMTVHGAPGRVLYAGAGSHVKLYELGGYARIAGLNLVEVDDRAGFLNLDQLKRVWSPDIYYMPPAGLVAVENTHNILGGRIYPVEELKQLKAFVQERQIKLHLDGARLFNAARASAQPATNWTRHVDSVMFCTSKGLGAPAGSLLTGKADFIEQARRVRKLLGGGMRQSGMIAAAGLYALQHHQPLLDGDHQRCRRVYDAMKDLPWLDPIPPETNILIVNLAEPCALDLKNILAGEGIGLLEFAADVIRLVFHHHISDAACERLISALKKYEV